MNACTGFSELTVEAVLELSGVGAGQGDGIAIDQGSSYRLTDLFQQVGRSLDMPVTTRGRGPHFGNTSRVDFGGRTALSAYVSWDGVDATTHTVMDGVENIDPDKLERLGEAITLALTVCRGQLETRTSVGRKFGWSDDYAGLATAMAFRRKVRFRSTHRQPLPQIRSILQLGCPFPLVSHYRLCSLGNW